MSKRQENNTRPKLADHLAWDERIRQLPDGLFVDDVRLMIKTQPLLPLRVVD